MNGVSDVGELVAGLQGVSPAVDASQKRRQLRHVLSQPKPVIVPGVTDALGARLATRAGFAAVYASGAGIANAQFGLPDLGLISLGEVLDQVSPIVMATDLPVIVDADTGFGGPVMAMRTTAMLEKLGVAAIQVEDQEMPKRCGHFDSHALVPMEHMQSKIAAMCTARQDESLVLIARTDARSAYGDITEAIRRARGYVEAGADAIFVEAPRTVDELRLVRKELSDVPLVVNVVEGGKTPQLSFAEYADLGFEVVLYANFLLRAMMKAGGDALQHLHGTGETANYVNRIVTWDERQSAFNLSQFTAAEEHFDRPWGAV